jgi:hypothetical protein
VDPDPVNPCSSTAATSPPLHNTAMPFGRHAHLLRGHLLYDLTELLLPWDPDPPTSFDVVGILNPRVGVVYALPLVAIAVDPLGELGKRIAPLYVVVEPTERESQPLTRADQVRIGADRPAVGQPYAAPKALFRTAEPPQGDAREGISRLYVVQLEPL